MLLDHIKSTHPDWPFDKPKGGVVVVDRQYEDTGGMKHAAFPEGVCGKGTNVMFGTRPETRLLKPGTYDIDVQMTDGSVVTFQVILPNWGDRFYIDARTGETILQTWQELTGK